MGESLKPQGEVLVRTWRDARRVCCWTGSCRCGWCVGSFYWRSLHLEPDVISFHSRFADKESDTQGRCDFHSEVGAWPGIRSPVHSGTPFWPLQECPFWPAVSLVSPASQQS